MGRPTKYTPERVKTICDYLRAGSTRRAAYLSAGVSHETFSTWQDVYPAFFEAITRAEGEAEAACAATLLAAVRDGEWRASVEWLKRRRRSEWGDSIDIRQLPDETLVRLLEGALGDGGEAPGAEAALAGSNGKH